MNVETDLPDRTIWLDADDPSTVMVIDQRLLPGVHATLPIRSVEEMVHAITDMVVRGAGCIGVSAAFGMYLAASAAADNGPTGMATFLEESAAALRGSRPTAVNLDWAVSRQMERLTGITDGAELVETARQTAQQIAEDDVARCASIGQHGLSVIADIHDRTDAPVRILTHCNAGWLAFVEHGSATAPIYAAHRAGIPVHVIVGETRPRSQGALTAWELGRAGVPHTFVVDNAVGHLIQRGEVDMVITGADRVTMQGDVANKIGTYLRALAARAHDVPFYVAFPSSTLDPQTVDGIAEIPIEERDPDEVTGVVGRRDGATVSVQVAPAGTAARNPAFDVTPAALVTGLITDRGICPADPESIAAMHGTGPADV